MGADDFYVSTSNGWKTASQIIAATNGPGIAQAIWYIDPQNTTTASNANDGLTTATALRTYAEVVRRWGGTTPNLRQSTRIIFLSSHTDDSDPVVCTPLMSNGATISIESVPTVVATGVVLSGVTAKSTAAGANALLTCNLGASGSLDVLVKNTTGGKSSIACVYALTSGTTFKMCNPFVPTGVNGAYNPAQVNTWANGDTVDLIQPQAVNLVRFDPTLDITDAAFTDWGHLYQITVFLPPGFAATQRVHIGQSVRAMECVFKRAIFFDDGASPSPSPFLTTVLTNCQMQSGMDGATGAAATLWGGGNIANSASNVGMVSFSGGYVTNCRTSVWDNASLINGELWIDHPFFVNAQLTIIAGSVIYGGSEMRIQGNARVQLDPAATYAATFTYPNAIATGIKMNEGLVASSISGTTPQTINGGIATTVANLDAAAGAAGFGGLAFVPGGSTIVKAAA